jgi:hypothetical protein
MKNKRTLTEKELQDLYMIHSLNQQISNWGKKKPNKMVKVLERNQKNAELLNSLRYKDGLRVFSEFEYRKYQKRWHDRIETDRNIAKMTVIQAVTGAGKSTVMLNYILKSKTKTFLVRTAPFETIVNDMIYFQLENMNENISYFIMNNKYSNLKKDARKMVDRLPKVFVLTTSKRDNVATMKKAIQRGDNIVMDFGLESFARNINKIVKDLTVDLTKQGYDRVMFADEVHYNTHSTSEKNVKLNNKQVVKGQDYDKKTIGKLKEITKYGFKIFGFSATPSLEQQNAINSNDFFDYIPFNMMDFEEVHKNSSYLDNVTFLQGEYDYKDSVKNSKLLKETTDIAFQREGTMILYVARSNTKYGITIDETKGYLRSTKKYSDKLESIVFTTTAGGVELGTGQRLPDIRYALNNFIEYHLPG